MLKTSQLSLANEEKMIYEYFLILFDGICTDPHNELGSSSLISSQEEMAWLHWNEPRNLKLSRT